MDLRADLSQFLKRAASQDKQPASQDKQQRHNGQLQATTDVNWCNSDDFNQQSIYITAYDDKVIVGTIQFVPGPDNYASKMLAQMSPLQPLQASVKNADTRHHFTEFSQLVVCPNILGESSVALSLMVELSKLAIEYQQQSVAAVLPVATVEFIQSLGIRFQIACSQPIYYQGILHLLVVYQPARVILQAKTTANEVMLKRLYPESQPICNR
ncbi:MAG: hypothetical protein KUG79_14135 [Pseudomonadales bacterium]|nr:hypothetical protein [Pseudomonadales bacterium]